MCVCVCGIKMWQQINQIGYSTEMVDLISLCFKSVPLVERKIVLRKYVEEGVDEKNV